MMQQTSLSAYYDFIPKLSNIQVIILKTINDFGPLSNSMISNYTGIPINIVTARVYELRLMNLVKEYTKDHCRITGKLVIYWKINEGGLNNNLLNNYS